MTLIHWIVCLTNLFSEVISMKNIVSELYYGNIDPQARGFKNGSFLKKQMAVLSESEATLTEKLTGEEKEVCFIHRKQL